MYKFFLFIRFLSLHFLIILTKNPFEFSGIGLFYSLCHCIVKIRNALSAMLVVLIRLDCDTCQSGITLNTLRRPDEPVTGRKTTLCQCLKVNLAASFCERVKIKIVDMDIPALICLLLLLRQIVFTEKKLARCSSYL